MKSPLFLFLILCGSTASLLAQRPMQITSGGEVITVNYPATNGVLMTRDDVDFSRGARTQLQQLLYGANLITEPPHIRYVLNVDVTNRPQQFFFQHATPIIVEDFSSLITRGDAGLNQMQGNMGLINQNDVPFGTVAITNGELELHWDFSLNNDPGAFTGFFWSLFGLTENLVSYDGGPPSTLKFTEHSLNFDNIDGLFREPGGPRRIVNVGYEFAYDGAAPVDIQLELKDAGDTNARLVRAILHGFAGNPQIVLWDFRDPDFFSGQTDITRAKILAVIIKRQTPSGNNPLSGTLHIRRVMLIPNKVEQVPVNDDALLDLVQRRACQYPFDWNSRKPGSRGLPADRANFPDLLTVGGLGFSIPMQVSAIERGWAERDDVIPGLLETLRLLGNPTNFGPEVIGKVGYHGWFYHFLGPNGFRKQNFDFPQTTEDESQGKVELSAIDTGLALMGMLAAQSYFNRNTPEEQEIRALVQAIYERVDWRFMVHEGSKQLYLGWRPETNEHFQIPDGLATGYFSGKPVDPDTLDYYTDELMILILLAGGAPDQTVVEDIARSWIQTYKGDGLTVTYPGALFTYQFLHAFVNTQTNIFPAPRSCAGIDLFANSRKAILQTIDYCATNPFGFLTYGSNAWGISAREGADDNYKADGAPPVSADNATPQDGTIEYYPMVSSVSFGTDLKAKTVAALRQAFARGGHWHPRFGLPDAFNDDIRTVQALITNQPPPFRSNGTWVSRAQFIIDIGPMALHLENARSGLIWSLLATNPNIQRGFAKLQTLVTNPAIRMEAESGSGDGTTMIRGDASGLHTVWLHAEGAARTNQFYVANAGDYQLRIRYSNDNFGALETINLSIDGTPAGEFVSEDTGDFGFGWNVFREAIVGPIPLSFGPHTLRIEMHGGDGNGIEIDKAELKYVCD